MMCGALYWDTSAQSKHGMGADFASNISAPSMKPGNGDRWKGTLGWTVNSSNQQITEVVFVATHLDTKYFWKRLQGPSTETSFQIESVEHLSHWKHDNAWLPSLCSHHMFHRIIDIQTETQSNHNHHNKTITSPSEAQTLTTTFTLCSWPSHFPSMFHSKGSLGTWLTTHFQFTCAHFAPDYAWPFGGKKTCLKAPHPEFT